VDRGDIVAARASSDDGISAASDAARDFAATTDIEHAQGNISARSIQTADLVIPTQPADRRAAVRWLVSAVFAIAFHGAIATLMLHWREAAGASMPAEPIMIELTPVAPASTSVPEAEAPDAPEQPEDPPDKLVENMTRPIEAPIPDKAEPVEPQRPQTDENKPEKMVPTEPQSPVIAEMEQKSEVELPPKKQAIEKPAQKKKHEAKHAQSQERAKPETAKPAAAAAPSGGPSPSDWTRQVIGILEQNKRYPPGAEPNHELGTAHLAFTINRQGRVISAHISGSSGSAALDAETLALVHRVSFPPPPAEMAGNQISLNVSLRYK
jgi:periplasmic protein TonB